MKVLLKTKIEQKVFLKTKIEQIVHHVVRMSCWSSPDSNLKSFCSYPEVYISCKTKLKYVKKMCVDQVKFSENLLFTVKYD